MSEIVTSRMPAARQQLNPTIGLVPFLFGVAQADELGGVALVRLLGDFGIGDVAARGQLARMRRDGQLTAIRHGRQVDYRLAGPFAATARRLRTAGERPVPVWEGQFHALLYQLPEAQRAYRDRLRRVARLVGYGLVQHGVLIAARDRTGDLAEVLAEVPSEGRVQRATLGLPLADAAEIARTAWDLDPLRDRLQGHIVSLEAAMRENDTPPPTAATLRRFAQLLNGAYVDLIRDPGLPSELLPTDWPKHRLTVLIGQLQKRYLAPAAHYLRAVVESSGSAMGSRP